MVIQLNLLKKVWKNILSVFEWLRKKKNIKKIQKKNQSVKKKQN